MRCFRCHKKPNELPEYVEQAELECMTAEEYVTSEEGTYDPATNHFVCTNCYIDMGMPLNGSLAKIYRGII